MTRHKFWDDKEKYKPACNGNCADVLAPFGSEAVDQAEEVWQFTTREDGSDGSIVEGGKAKSALTFTQISHKRPNRLPVKLCGPNWERSVSAFTTKQFGDLLDDWSLACWLWLDQALST